MATIGEKLAQPEAGWKRIDDSVGLIKYDGTWQVNMNNSTSWLGTRHISSNLPDKVVKLVFKGTKFRLLVNSASNRSTNSTITIDGESHTFSSRFTTTLTIAPTRLAFEKLDLVDGYHTVIITDTTTDYIDIDAFDIDEDGEVVRYDYLDNRPFDEKIQKYGVAWFGFDEESGNVLDKLDDEYIGTVTNGTRTEGWNKEGNSLSFTGNGFVTFNNQVIPLTEKTISFKVKPTSSTGIMRLLDASVSASSGFSVMLVDGVVRFIIRANGTPNYVDSPTKVNINEWNDVFISYNGLNERGNAYIGVNGNFSTYYLNAYDTSPYAYLYIGKTNPTFGTTASTEFIKGEIDDLKIYAKSFKPNTLPEKYVVIETTDGKYISLPNKQGRVKELPSGEEMIVVDHGYNWKDVDSAEGTDGIELSHSTTEYEIVGNSAVSLGNGKMFTIPIENFKTVKVESNN